MQHNTWEHRNIEVNHGILKELLPLTLCRCLRLLPPPPLPLPLPLHLPLHILERRTRTATRLRTLSHHLQGLYKQTVHTIQLTAYACVRAHLHPCLYACLHASMLARLHVHAHDEAKTRTNGAG